MHIRSKNLALSFFRQPKAVFFELTSSFIARISEYLVSLEVREWFEAEIVKKKQGEKADLKSTLSLSLVLRLSFSLSLVRYKSSFFIHSKNFPPCKFVVKGGYCFSSHK